MSLYWILPPLIVLAGSALLLWVMHQVQAEAKALRHQLVRVETVREATAQARAASSRCGGAWNDLQRR